MERWEARTGGYFRPTSLQYVVAEEDGGGEEKGEEEGEGEGGEEEEEEKKEEKEKNNSGRKRGGKVRRGQTSKGTSCFLFYFLCMGAYFSFACMYICVPHLCLMSVEVRIE